MPKTWLKTSQESSDQQTTTQEALKSLNPKHREQKTEPKKYNSVNTQTRGLAKLGTSNYFVQIV